MCSWMKLAVGRDRRLALEVRWLFCRYGAGDASLSDGRSAKNLQTVEIMATECGNPRGLIFGTGHLFPLVTLLQRIEDT